MSLTQDQIREHAKQIEIIRYSIHRKIYNGDSDIRALTETNAEAYKSISDFRKELDDQSRIKYPVASALEDLSYQDEKEYDLLDERRGKTRIQTFDDERKKLETILMSYITRIRELSNDYL